MKLVIFPANMAFTANLAKTLALLGANILKPPYWIVQIKISS